MKKNARFIDAPVLSESLRKMFKSLKADAGLSLIELLVSVSIIGILSAGLLATLNPLEQLKKGNDVERKSDLALIQRALESFYNDHGQYPATGAGNKIQNTLGAVINWGSPFTEGSTTYMRILPKDPKDPTHTYYYIQVGGQGYRLYAYLERDIRDPQVCTGISCPNKTAAVTCGAGVQCNYGVSSSNTKP